MKSRIKIGLCGMLLVIAALLVNATINSFAVNSPPAGNTGRNYTAIASESGAKSSSANGANSSGANGANSSGANGGRAAYVLGAYEGNVAIFTNGGDKPQTVTSIELITLPAIDRLALESGISVSSYDALLRLLEDFGS